MQSGFPVIFYGGVKYIYYGVNNSQFSMYESNILFCLNDSVSFIKIRVNLKWRKNWKMLG